MKRSTRDGLSTYDLFAGDINGESIRETVQNRTQRKGLQQPLKQLIDTIDLIVKYTLDLFVIKIVGTQEINYRIDLGFFLSLFDISTK